MLVACSGGPDSQALLQVLHALQLDHGCQLVAASVDHGLRPEAAGEVALAGRLAAKLAVPFVPLRVTVASGASRQAAAREARYAALLQCARDHGAERIAVGHTRDDQAETVLARILRGAGIEGLSAVTPRRADGVVRPLIDCRRELIHRFVAEAELACVDDPSNLDRRYLRVRVRRDLLPQLSLENPQLAEHLAYLADDAREAAALIHERAAAALARSGRSAAALREEPSLVRRWALKLLVEQEARAKLSRAHLTSLDRMLSLGGQVRVPGDLVVSVDADGELAFARSTKRGRGSSRRNEAQLRSRARPGDRSGTS